MVLSKNYKSPIVFEDLENQDLSSEKANGMQYKDEIEHFKHTAELYISLFSNSKRSTRDNLKVDYVQLLAVKMLQDTRAAMILALKGLFPQSSSLLRGTIESYYLLYDFKINQQHEDLWFEGSKNKRVDLFKLDAIKTRVIEADVIDTTPLKNLYSLLSQFSVHVNMESHLWYVETRNSKLFYHWAGYDSDKKSATLVHSCLNALAQGLFIFTYEGFYTHDKNWYDDFTKWKKQHLDFFKKFAKVHNYEGYEELEVKKDTLINVNNRSS